MNPLSPARPAVPGSPSPGPAALSPGTSAGTTAAAVAASGRRRTCPFPRADAQVTGKARTRCPLREHGRGSGDPDVGPGAPEKEQPVMGLQSIDVDHIQVRLVARTLHGKQLDVGRMLQVRIAAELGREGSTRPSWKRRACRHRRLRWLRRARTSTRVLTAGQIPSRWAGPPAAPDASRAPWRLAAARSRRIPQTTLRTQVRRGRARIPEQFALAPCRDAGVERSDRQAGSDPPGRGRDSRADVNAMSTGPLSDRREVRLGVDVAQHEAGVRWPRRRTGRARRTATRRRPPGRARTGARGRAAAGTAGWRSAGRSRYRRLPTNVPPRPVATQIQWRWQRPTWPLRPERSHRTQPGPSRRSRIRRDHPAPEPT